MKNYLEQIRSEWTKCFTEMTKQKGFQRLMGDDLTVEHYKSALRQIYLQTRDNPSLQAAATLKFEGVQRDIMRKFMGHALSEVGHDQLALSDLAHLGEDLTALPTFRPLPGTAALMAFGYYAAMSCKPAVYLGYLYHLESMPIKSGGTYLAKLRALGVPEEALTFIDEHAKFDIAHMKLNDEYIGVFVKNEENLQDFLYGMKTCSILYAGMLEHSFAAVDQGVTHFNVNLSENREFPLPKQSAA